MKKLLIAIAIFLASTGILHASCDWNGNIGTTSSLTTANINECISEASVLSGEVTINLSAGTLSLGSTININMSSGFANVTSLRIFGNGTVPTGTTKGSAGNTTITNNGASRMFTITTSSTKKFRMSNFKITGTYAGWDAAIVVLGNTKPSLGGGFRIDHLDSEITQTGSYAWRVIWINSPAYGVIDHNNLETQSMCIEVQHGGDTAANLSWNTAITFGIDNVYVEDNNLTNTHASNANKMALDCGDGGRVTARYNTLTNYYFGGHDTSTSPRGCFSYVAYNNTLNLNLTRMGDPLFNLRGGTHIIYNNTMTSSVGYYQSPIGLWNARSHSYLLYGTPSVLTDYCDTTHRVQVCVGPLHGITYPNKTGITVYGFGDATQTGITDYCTSDADCGGETGACQYLDGTGTNGWPCRDQIGMSYTTADGYTNYPSLFWNNTYNGSTTNPVDKTYTSVIQNNRDFCYHATTMPATCNSIATTYSAYTYPHPLTGGGGEEDTIDPILSAWFPTTQQTCSADPQTISIGITSSDQNITTCKWDTSTAAYADLTNTFDGAAAGTVNHTDSASFDCNATHTIYYACSDDKGNVTDTASWTFSLPALLDETTPVITSVTSSKQAYYTTQKLSVTTSVAGSCRYCVNGVGGCASDTAWASRTAFSVTGGETTHHEVSITQAASSSATYNVICQNTQGTATSTNSAITITTDAAKSITAGTGSLSITQGSGSLSVTILP